MSPLRRASHLKRVWFEFGSRWVRVGFEFGSSWFELVRVWFELVRVGSSLVRVWFEFGPSSLALFLSLSFFVSRL